MKGIVLKSTGSWYKVLGDDDRIYDCRVRGKFRLYEELKATNPVTVGDKVEFEYDKPNKAGVINVLSERDNYIIRKASNLSKQVHVIAANIDEAWLIATLKKPRTSRGFIDRFLVTCEAYNIKPGLIFNKTDILNDKESDTLKDLSGLYSGIGYDCYQISAKNIPDVEKIGALFRGKINLLTGHSGVGKSTLLNSLYPQLDLKVGEVSEFHNKGKHTTTFVQMHEVEKGTFIIDTPGIKEFGLVNFEPYEVSHFFPEMIEPLEECRFNTCLHINEPGCGVKKALDAGEVDPARYKSYLSIVNSIIEEEKMKFK